MVCWKKLSEFNEFYLAVNEANDKYSAQYSNDGEPFRDDSADVIVNNPGIISCKVEPPEMIEFDENPQSIDDTFENLPLSPFGDEDFTPAATIDQRDFDAIFIEEFSAECDVKVEEAAPVERYVDRADSSENISVAEPVREPEPGGNSIRRSRRISTAARQSSQESRKRPAESSDELTICEHCGEPFMSLHEMGIHSKEVHFISGGNANVEAKRAKQ